MKLSTITEVSKDLGLSTRTLRYYEQIGLIKSVKKDNYAYRTYTQSTISRLQHIVVLRKLRISLKQINEILQNEATVKIINIFEKQLIKLDNEITVLATIREAVNKFIKEINNNSHQNIKLEIFDDPSLLEVVDTLSILKKQPKFSMGFDIAHNDQEMIEIFNFYEKAFGATKIAEFTPHESNKENLHIIMNIYGIEILLHPVATGEEKIQTAGTWTYDNDDLLKRAIDILSKEAQKVVVDSWPHWPICAFITDKYGVEWTLHN